MPILRREFDEINLEKKSGLRIEDILRTGKFTVAELSEKIKIKRATLWNKLNDIQGIKHKRPYWWLDETENKCQ